MFVGYISKTLLDEFIVEFKVVSSVAIPVPNVYVGVLYKLLFVINELLEIYPKSYSKSQLEQIAI